MNEVLSSGCGIQLVLSKWKLLRTEPICCQGVSLHEAGDFSGSGTPRHLFRSWPVTACSSVQGQRSRRWAMHKAEFIPFKAQSFYVRFSSLLLFFRCENTFVLWYDDELRR